MRGDGSGSPFGSRPPVSHNLTVVLNPKDEEEEKGEPGLKKPPGIP